MRADFLSERRRKRDVRRVFLEFLRNPAHSLPNFPPRFLVLWELLKIRDALERTVEEREVFGECFGQGDRLGVKRGPDRDDRFGNLGRHLGRVDVQ